jgi:hypothetical protein
MEILEYFFNSPAEFSKFMWGVMIGAAYMCLSCLWILWKEGKDEKNN